MWVLFLLLMCGIARADVYVITAKDNSIYSISEADDAVIPIGYNKNIIKGTISNLPISGDVKLYNFSNGTFVLNPDKIKAKNIEEQSNINSENDEKNNKASAIAKLKKIGLNDDEIGALIK